MLKLTLLTLTLLAVAPVFGQVAPPATQTASIAGARFEVIQSGLAARDTFKADRFTGEVYMLVKDHDGSSVWVLTKWIGKPETGTATGPRFQLFLGTQRERDIFLLDCTTGKTWEWVLIGNVQELTASISDRAWWPMKNGVVITDK